MRSGLGAHVVGLLGFCYACSNISPNTQDGRPLDAPNLDALRRADAPAVDARLADAASPDSSARDAPLGDSSASDAPADAIAAVDAPQADAAPDASLTDASAPDAEVPSIFCNSDQIAGILSGARSVGSMSQFVPLCSGELLVGDPAGNQVLLTNIVSGRTLRSYPLPGSPGDMDLDEANGILYVALPASLSLCRVDLTSGQTDTFVLPHHAVNVAVGGGVVFVNGYDNGPFMNSDLLVVDGMTGAVLQEVATSSSTSTVVIRSMVYDQVGHQLVTWDSEALYRYAVDPSGRLSLVQTRPNVMNGLPGLAVSPLGRHLACNCPTFGEVPDYDADNLNMIFGGWNITWPLAEAFAPDGASITFLPGGGTAAGITNVEVFSVATHLLQSSFNAAVQCGQYPYDPKLARYSRGGRILYIYGTCYAPPGSGSLSWVVISQ